MNIGIDIDDTLNNLSDILIEYGKKYNKENAIEHEIQENRYDFEEAFGWNKEQENKFKEQYIATCLSQATIKNGAKEYIHKLKGEGHKVYIITARTPEETVKNVQEISEEWLKRNGIELDKLEVGCEQKVDKCREHKIDVFIDDNTDHCKAVHESLGIPVILFDSIYNQGVKDFNRVYNWEEAYELIKKYDNK